MKNSNCKFSTSFNLYPYKIRCVDFRWLRHSFKKIFCCFYYLLQSLKRLLFRITSSNPVSTSNPRKEALTTRRLIVVLCCSTAWYFRSLYFLTSNDGFCKSKPFRAITLIPLLNKVKRYRQNIFLKFLRPIAVHKNGDFFAGPCDACDG